MIQKVSYANGEVNAVETDAGTIACDYFVNSAGFVCSSCPPASGTLCVHTCQLSASCTQMANYIGHKSDPPIELPLMPTQTNVLFTQPIPELSGRPFPSSALML